MGWLKKTGLAHEKYMETCKQLKRKPLAPILDVETRWNSTYAMLLRALQIKGVSILKLVFSICAFLAIYTTKLNFNGFLSRFLNNSSLIILNMKNIGLLMQSGMISSIYHSSLGHLQKPQELCQDSLIQL